MMLWCDGFELASVSAIVARYDAASTAGLSRSSTNGRTNQYLGLFGESIEKRFTNTSEIVIGIARKVTASWSERDFLILKDTDNNIQLVLRENAAGTVSLYRGDPAGAGTLLATSSAMTPGFWVYYELKAVIDNANGSYEFRINETTQFSASNVDTQATIRSNVERLSIRGVLTNGGSSDDNYIDDLYIANMTAPAPIGYFFGNTKVEHIVPNGAGDITGWSRVNLSNWQNVDENPHNSDTDYNYSNTVNQSDLYTMGNLSTTDGRLRSLQVTHISRKDDALTRAVRPLIKTGGTIYGGSNDSLTTSYVHYFEVWDQNPSTSSEWSISAVNSLQVGIQTTS